VFLLSKNNVIHPPTRFYVAWVMMPLFVLLLLAIFIVTMLLGISSISNADFCSGGIDGTMQGTLEDALLAYFNGGDLRTRINTTGMSISTMEQARHTPPVSMAYAAIDYYASVSSRKKNGSSSGECILAHISFFNPRPGLLVRQSHGISRRRHCSARCRCRPSQSIDVRSCHIGQWQ
jgi:hypothetical protein